MNRAERRRQAKTTDKPSVPLTESRTRQFSVATIKNQLQQATSPEEVRQLLDGLVRQELPAMASAELSAYTAQYHETTAALRDGSDVESVAAVVDNAHTWADAMIDRSPERDRRACRAGCAFCCYLPTVLVTAAEVVHLAAWLQEHLSPEELSALRQRLAQRCEQTAQSSSFSRSETSMLPCALLRNNQCMAYAARPLKCRGWNSLRREACEQAYGHDSLIGQVPADAYAFLMGNAVLNGLSDGVKHVKLDGGSYDLSFALAQVLDMPDVVQRWRTGEQLFADSL
ncbi:MAG: YkgJ family cysteine cluster protein [Deltaproteobacteria bacterium]|nr:YkgJ family cysteine cluster protein [Deltaproteobacteria bacterium]